MTTPSLLLSPDGSRDADGPVTPTVSAGVTVVAGQYGNAWLGAGSGVYLPTTGRWSGTVGTVLVRGRLSAAEASTPYSFYVGGGSPNRFYMGSRFSSAQLLIGGSSNYQPTIDPFDYEQFHVHAARYNNGVAQQFLNGAALPQVTYTGTALGATDITVAPKVTTSTPYIVESALIFPVALSNAETARISDIAETWTWDNVQASPRRIFPVLKVGSQHIGPLRAGKA